MNEQERTEVINYEIMQIIRKYPIQSGMQAIFNIMGDILAGRSKAEKNHLFNELNNYISFIEKRKTRQKFRLVK